MEKPLFHDSDLKDYTRLTDIGIFYECNNLCACLSVWVLERKRRNESLNLALYINDIISCRHSALGM